MAMVDICPTITTDSPQQYKEQVEKIAPFSVRVHIDVADGKFTPNKLTPIDSIWWPGGMRADIHVMYQRPFEHLDELIALGPQLIIVHAEAEGDFITFAKKLHAHGIEAGVALLPQTDPNIIKPGLPYIDHALIFSGNLGHQGGSAAHLPLLHKVTVIKTLKPTIEIGWDGGVNANNAKALIDGGIEVLNVGGFIQNAPNAQDAYTSLQQVVGLNDSVQ